jgi:hypothetical protein
MPDLSASWDIPNPFALVSADFSYDLDGYRAALGFLSDLAGGSVEAEALAANGGSPAQLTGWKRSEKFRRVYAKCVAAGEAEQEALRARESAAAATDAQEATQPQGQVFIPLEEAPVQRSVFALTPNRDSWGG